MDGISVTPKASPQSVEPGYSADNLHPVAGLLGLDTHNLSGSDTEVLQKIYEFVRGDEKEMTQLELLSKVRSLEQRLGMTSLGERRVDKIYRYVKLQSQIDNLSKQRDGELR